MSYLSPKFVTHEAAGEDRRFYPVSVTKAFKLKRVAGPVAQALSTMLSDRSADVGQKHTEIKNTLEGEIKEVVVEPMTPEMASMRAAQQERSIQGLVDAFTDEQTGVLLAELIQDSLREEFPRGDKSNIPASEFLGQLDVDSFLEMVFGLVKANAKVLDPFKGAFSQRLQSALAQGLSVAGSADKETAGKS